jgi:hypothetical protein
MKFKVRLGKFGKVAKAEVRKLIDQIVHPEDE